MVEKYAPRGRGRPRKFDQTEALDKAVDVFWELGFEAADTETLSTRMGISKPSLYNAFGSKEDLFLAALKRYRETLSKAASDKLLQAASPREGLHDFFMAVARDVSGQDHPSGCLVACVAMPLSERMPKVADILRTSPDEGPAGMTNYFSNALREGSLPKSFNVPAALALIQDLGIAMGVKARAGATLAELEAMAVRNAELVMLEGER